LVHAGLVALLEIVASRARRPSLVEFFTATIRTGTVWLGFGSGCHNRGKTALTSAKPDQEKALIYLLFFVLDG
jgi:hypothetical protein